jgi:hypothetical protein
MKGFLGIRTRGELMKSEIWRVKSEKMGSLEAFRSERDMESFLINNPAIVGCWDPDASSSVPSLIREQISTSTGKTEKGRMDLVGIARTEKGYELRIFELKAVEIIESAVDQLNAYLKGWNLEDSAKKAISSWILELDLDGVSETNVGEIVTRPVGILIGPRFSVEARAKAKAQRIKAIRLARFKAASSPEYYVIVEDEVGDIVDSGRRSWSWKDLISTGQISEEDFFVIRREDNMLRAKPDSSTLDWFKKKVLFDEESVRVLLDKEPDIRSRANLNDHKWIDREFASLRNGTGVFLSNATGLCYLAFGGPTASYWVPNWWWIHEKTGKRLDDIVKGYMNQQ